ncbi:aldo/keto reductase [Alloscardovia criceti]|uniref:aldo/keto reductase n=1 Tax=Alloscardovia criceti TaxID=356828 RepID=UPI00036D9A08|nr:aldo/keto reductase [Alloscardovia criceti]
METLTLSNGVEIPKLGFGVFQIPQDETIQAVHDALEVGYRHFDTAQSYFNEEQLGEALADSGINRSELFITTKVWLSHYGYEQTKASVEESLKKLRTDYADLILLHQPFNDVYGSWRALEDLYEEGKIRAIGVSNFNPGRVADLAAFNRIAPMVNQIETNPFHQRSEEHDEMLKRGVVHEAWAPFGEGRAGVFDNPVLAQIAQKYDKSVAQVILRWLTQRDVVALAKSAHKERMEQNFHIFDFRLTDEDMQAIAGLDTGESLFFNHEDPSTVDMFVHLIQEREGRA